MNWDVVRNMARKNWLKIVKCFSRKKKEARQVCFSSQVFIKVTILQPNFCIIQWECASVSCFMAHTLSIQWCDFCLMRMMYLDGTLKWNIAIKFLRSIAIHTHWQAMHKVNQYSSTHCRLNKFSAYSGSINDKWNRTQWRNNNQINRQINGFHYIVLVCRTL